MPESQFAHGELSGKIIKGFRQTHEELGSGFSERVYRNAVAIALADLGLQVEVEVPLKVNFRGRTIGSFFADIVANDTILIEIKAAASLEAWMQAQLLNYLKAAGGGIGLLLNFGRHPEHKRMIVDNPTNCLPLLQRREGPAAAPSAGRRPARQAHW